MFCVFVIIFLRIALFELEEFENSKKVLQSGKLLCDSRQNEFIPVYDRWIRKCDAELKGLETLLLFKWFDVLYTI